jgi:hypothetical protein
MLMLLVIIWERLAQTQARWKYTELGRVESDVNEMQAICNK